MPGTAAPRRPRMETTRRVQITAAGGPEVIQLVSGPLPQPRARQVRVRVEAAGVAYGDVMRRRGVLAPRPPFTPGYDIVGIVDALGAKADPAWQGKRVAAMMPKMGIGGCAEHVCLASKTLVPVPDGVDPVEAVALGLNYITAYQLIHNMARLQAGQSVLIHGAAGGVGTALLDLGQQLQLRMFGTASAPKHDAVRARGGVPIDYRNEDFVARMAELCPAGVHAVFDGIGGSNLPRSYQTLGPRGSLVWFGLSGVLAQGYRGVLGTLGTLLRLKLKFDRRRVKLYAISMSRGAAPKHCRRDWQTLLQMRLSGQIAPLIGARLPLSQAAEAHDLLERAGTMGKIVLTCGDGDG